MSYACVTPTNYILVTDAAVEPITLSEIKTNLKITTTDYDDILQPMIKTAVTKGEQITGRDFITKKYKTFIDYFPGDQFGIKILKSKLQAIDHIKYYKDDLLVTLNAADYYITDDADYAYIFLKSGKSFPRDIDDRAQAVQITFDAGYGDTAADVPQGIKQALIAYIAMLYNNAGDCPLDEADNLAFNLLSGYIISELLFDVI